MCLELVQFQNYWHFLVQEYIVYFTFMLIKCQCCWRNDKNTTTWKRSGKLFRVFSDVEGLRSIDLLINTRFFLSLVSMYGVYIDISMTYLPKNSENNDVVMPSASAFTDTNNNVLRFHHSVSLYSDWNWSFTVTADRGCIVSRYL